MYGNDSDHKCSGGFSIQKLNTGENYVGVERWTKTRFGGYGYGNELIYLSLVKFGKLTIMSYFLFFINVMCIHINNLCYYKTIHVSMCVCVLRIDSKMT